MDPLQRAQALLQECNQIVVQLEAWRVHNPSFGNIEGLQLMTSNLLAERRFLEKIVSTPTDEIRIVQVNSSNVPYFRALVHTLVHCKNPVAIRKTFSYSLDPYTSIMPTESFRSINTAGARHKKSATKSHKQPTMMSLVSSQPLSTQLPNNCTLEVKVDIVADHGMSWLRINAGSAWSIIHEFAEMEDDSDDDDDDDDSDSNEDGAENKGELLSSAKKPELVSKATHPDMTLLVRSLVLAADQNRLHYYHRPQLTLRFAGFSSLDGEEDNGTIPERTKAHPGMDPKYHPFPVPLIVDDMELFTETLHLDITTLMALSSVLCHRIGLDPNAFTSPPLILQVQQEHQQPILPILAKVFEGRKRLVISRAGVTRFRSILEIIGGSEEKWRGKVLIHDPLETKESSLADENASEIRERWVQGSDWALRFGVFADGPPRIDVIEDCLREEVDVVGKVSDSTVTATTATMGTGSEGKTKEQVMSELHSRIFMTGYHGRLTTITANQVGYRAVLKAGLIPLAVSVWFHAPRSLAEAKLPEGHINSSLE
ncbi:hypothetical protein BGW38_010502 [Lunasporangiospora selenospora]|uniref:DUF1308 domain-containing protein n=1 Tax=Lunasporangiospora selenospora TaxID=979761 RepID=A0A9P6KFH3_9FUNG|nr:hypothetical protein BGW38_010502 [Lunasporangiospora selenospora]